MSYQDTEQLDSTTQPTEEVVNTEATIEEPVAETETEDEAGKLKELNEKLYERTKKAEAELKELKVKLKPKTPEATSSSPDALPIADIAVLSRINEDDIAEVVEYAKFKGISPREALKTNVIKTMLAEKEEERKTAQATATGNQKRGTAKTSDEGLLEKAMTRGELPDSDADIARLVKLRKGLK